MPVAKEKTNLDGFDARVSQLSHLGRIIHL